MIKMATFSMLISFLLMWLSTLTDAIDTRLCKVTTQGTEYKGTLAVTETGLICQRWDSQSPHAHTRNNPHMFPETTLAESNNYCRNPDSEPLGPWCYTLDPSTRWQYCDVNHCSELDDNPGTLESTMRQAAMMEWKSDISAQMDGPFLTASCISRVACGSICLLTSGCTRFTFEAGTSVCDVYDAEMSPAWTVNKED